jgi:hypothetical protein
MAYEEAPDELASLAEGPLHAAPIDSVAGVAAREREEGYGDPQDERAISHLIEALSQQASSHQLDSAALRERAEGLYAIFCQQVSAGLGGEELVRVARLLGESPQALVERLGA